MFKSQISGIRWIFFSLYKVFLDDISYIVLLDDIVCFKRICNAVNAQGIKSAYFHTTDYCSRPLWTLSHEINCDIKFVFYSINVEIFHPESYLSNKTFNGWQLSVWDHVLAWTEKNRDFIQREFLEYHSIEIAGPFEASGQIVELDMTGRKALACFDVEPVRRSRFIRLGQASNYYDGNEAINFLKKTYAFCKKNNFVMIHKKKRNIGDLANKKYLNAIKDFDQNYYMPVDADVSASSLISATQFTVSMPFTSVALLAKLLGKPSFYIISEDYYYPGIERFSNVPVYTDFESIKFEL